MVFPNNLNPLNLIWKEENSIHQIFRSLFFFKNQNFLVRKKKSGHKKLSINLIRSNLIRKSLKKRLGKCGKNNGKKEIHLISFTQVIWQLVLKNLIFKWNFMLISTNQKSLMNTSHILRP